MSILLPRLIIEEHHSQGMGNVHSLYHIMACDGRGVNCNPRSHPRTIFLYCGSGIAAAVRMVVRLMGGRRPERCVISGNYTIMARAWKDLVVTSARCGDGS